MDYWWRDCGRGTEIEIFFFHLFFILSLWYSCWILIISIILILALIVSNTCIIYADDENEELDNDTIEVVNQSSDEPVLNSRIAVAYDRKSGNVIWGKNENKRSAMASTTKIMTAIVWTVIGLEWVNTLLY